MNRKICVVTGTRAEYGLLRPLIGAISSDQGLTLQLIATGMHLSPEFGLTYREIEQDGFTIDKRVDLLLSSDTEVGIAKSMGLGMIGFADAFSDLAPDIIVVLGDRFETFAAVSAALVARIPVAHLHGGEKTEGAFDEALRHAITKMSHLHFVAAEEYRSRVIQLGEQPERTFTVGGLGIDSIKGLPLLPREELEQSIGFQLRDRNLLLTFHPVTLEHNSAGAQMEELLAALSTLENTGLIFTLPNADTGGRQLIRQIESYASENDNAIAFSSLGQLRYLSAMAQVDGVVGNSSSGIIEAPAFHKGSVNIGDRQRGRLRAASVIDCTPDRLSIGQALDHLFSPDFQSTLGTISNPYGDGGASEKVLALLKSLSLDNLVKKPFYDLPTVPQQEGEQ